MRIAFGALLCAVIGWAPPGYAQAAPSPVSWNPATSTVTFALAAGAPGKSGPFNFNGYTTGAATLVVPAKSTIVMNFVNDDYTPHSAVIIGDAGPVPTMGGEPPSPGRTPRT